MFGPDTNLVLLNWAIGLGLFLLVGLGTLLWLLFGQEP